MSTNDTFFPINTFQKKLHEWYAANHRSLPWRETKDPYLIWLSEIILQQTRVAQGTEYYLRFASRWPTLQSLAMAKEQDVLKEWQGLGYYSRARNLLTAAKNMFATFGKFPTLMRKSCIKKALDLILPPLYRRLHTTCLMLFLTAMSFDLFPDFSA